MYKLIYFPPIGGGGDISPKGIYFIKTLYNININRNTLSVRYLIHPLRDFISFKEIKGSSETIRGDTYDSI